MATLYALLGLAAVFGFFILTKKMWGTLDYFWGKNQSTNKSENKD